MSQCVGFPKGTQAQQVGQVPRIGEIVAVLESGALWNCRGMRQVHWKTVALGATANR